MFERIAGFGLLGILGITPPHPGASPVAMVQYRTICEPTQLSISPGPLDQGLYGIVKRLVNCESYGGNIKREKDVFTDGFKYIPEPNAKVLPHTLATRVTLMNIGENRYIPVTAIFIDNIVLMYSPNGELAAAQTFNADYDLNSGHIGHTARAMNLWVVRRQANRLKDAFLKIVEEKYKGDIDPKTMQALELVLLGLTSAHLRAL